MGIAARQLEIMVIWPCPLYRGESWPGSMCHTNPPTPPITKPVHPLPLTLHTLSLPHALILAQHHHHHGRPMLAIIPCASAV
jgi:hypothetical protein